MSAHGCVEITLKLAGEAACRQTAAGTSFAECRPSAVHACPVLYTLRPHTTTTYLHRQIPQPEPTMEPRSSSVTTLRATKGAGAFGGRGADLTRQSAAGIGSTSM